MAVANTASAMQCRSDMSCWPHLEAFYHKIEPNLPSRLKEDIYGAIHDLAQGLAPE